MGSSDFLLEYDDDILDHDLLNISFNELENYCDLIFKIAGKENIDTEIIGKNTINSYYKGSGFFYRNFHSENGAMHLPVAEFPDQSHKEKLLFQANSIAKILEKNNYETVLELGCGMGFNANFLASNFKDKTFTAIDLTPQNIKFAKQKAANLSNISFNIGDFDELDLGKDKFDLIFAVETLCHSKDIAKLLNKLNKYLNVGGRIIIFDGYIKANARQLLNSAEKKAYQLLSWGFAMEKFQTFEEIESALPKASLTLQYSANYGKNVLSNLLAFQKGAKSVLRFSRLLKFLIKIGILPMALLKQISAGFFCAYFIQTDYLGYYQIELVHKTEAV